MKGALGNELLNVTPNIEQILSFEILGKNSFSRSLSLDRSVQNKIKSLE